MLLSIYSHKEGYSKIGSSPSKTNTPVLSFYDKMAYKGNKKLKRKKTMNLPIHKGISHLILENV